MPEFTEPELMELAKAIVLIVGVVISSAFFWLGWRIYRSHEWENRHNYITYKSVVDSQTNQWVLVPCLTDGAIDEILAPRPQPFQQIGQ
jgi:hypothetical protein